MLYSVGVVCDYQIWLKGTRNRIMKPLKIRIFMLISTFLLVAHVTQASSASDYFTQGCAASMARQWESSIDAFTKAIEEDPGNVAAFVQRAASLQMIDRIDDAIKDYESALKLKPDYYLALEYLANLYEVRNESAKALETYNRALPLVKDQKWRSIIMWKISEAKKKMNSQRARNDRSSNNQDR